MEGEFIMATFEEFKVSGVTKDTPKNIMLNACTLYKNMTFDSSTKNGQALYLVQHQVEQSFQLFLKFLILMLMVCL